MNMLLWIIETWFVSALIVWDNMRSNKMSSQELVLAFCSWVTAGMLGLLLLASLAFPSWVQF